MIEMNLLKKLNVLVPHWVAHNEEHIAEMERYLAALDAEGQTALASRCRDTIAQMKQVSEKLALMGEQLKPIKWQRG
nr:hypothetical protein [uncultured Enterobacter sp.]